MSRLMSVAMTEQAVVERRKTVTRRKGWWEDKNGRRLVLPGDTITLCRKVMGRKKGEPLVRLVDVEVIDVRRESLLTLTDRHLFPYPMYGQVEVELEGFPGMSPEHFVTRFFLVAQKMRLTDMVTRIEWRYLPDLCWIGSCGKPAQPEHAPCCSSHGNPMCCEHYCRHHFVQATNAPPRGTWSGPDERQE